MTYEEFRNYLLSKGLVKENQVAFYLKWVGEFLQFCNLKAGQSFIDKHVEAFSTYVPVMIIR